MSNSPFPCVVCGIELNNVIQPGKGLLLNQPYDGLELLGYGHYGCSVWDPITVNAKLVLNICDKCLLKAQEQKRVGVWSERRGLKYWEFESEYEL